jgi:hypothetical protein
VGPASVRAAAAAVAGDPRDSAQAQLGQVASRTVGRRTEVCCPHLADMLGLLVWI